MSIIDEVVGNVFEAFTGRSNDSLLPSFETSAADVLSEHVYELSIAAAQVAEVATVMISEVPVRKERVENVAVSANAILTPDLVPKPDVESLTPSVELPTYLAPVLSLEEARERRLAKQSLGHQSDAVDAARVLVAQKASNEARSAETVASVVMLDTAARDERMKLQAQGHVNLGVDAARDKVQEVLNRLGQAAA